jgi:hypothetical protein
VVDKFDLVFGLVDLALDLVFAIDDKSPEEQLAAIDAAESQALPMPPVIDLHIAKRD